MKEKILDLKYGKLHLLKTKKFRSITLKVLLSDVIKKEDIIGKAWIRLWPLNKLKIVKWLTFKLKSYKIIIGKVIER